MSFSVDSAVSVDDWDRRAYLLLTALFLWRLFFIVFAPMDLAPDEVYYWDWSRYPALGYYSKPPLIAWVNMVSSALLPVSAFSVRLPAAIFASLSLLIFHALGKRLFSSRTAFWALAAIAASPGNCVIGYIMTIDAPLFFFWSLAVYCFWRAVEDAADGYRWWLAAAVAAGFGLLSKQMMLAYLVLVILFLLTSRRDRHHLSSPRPYLVIFLALAALLPPLWWNMQHDWITFKHTAHHFESSPRRLHTIVDFIGGQLLLLSPLLCSLFALLTGSLLCRFNRQERRVRFLLLFGGSSLLLFLLMSMRQRINANWPAIFYPGGMLLLAAWGCGEISGGRFLADRWRKLFVPGVLVGALFALLTYALPLVLPLTSLGGGHLDPTARIKGWRQLAVAVEEVRVRIPEQEKLFLTSPSRQVVSELAFYLPGQPQVYMWSSESRVQSQYDLWAPPDLGKKRNGLVVLEGETPPPAGLRRSFASFEKIKEVDVSLGPGGTRRFALYLGHSITAWPR